MTLYELTHEFKTALAALNADEDIPPEAIRDTLDALKYPIEQKGRNVAAYLLNLEAEAHAVAHVEERIRVRRKILERRVAWLRDYLHCAMSECGISEIKALDGSFTAAIRQSPAAVIVDDEAALPLWAVDVVHTTRVHKEAIRQAIQAGADVPGARLVAGTHLVVK